MRCRPPNRRLPNAEAELSAEEMDLLSDLVDASELASTIAESATTRRIMTSLAERAAQLSPNARAALARELVRAGTAFPTDIAEPIAGWASVVVSRVM